MDVLVLLSYNTAHVRKLLFDLLIPFSLSRTNYKLFWPLIDNVYLFRIKRHVTDKSGDYIRHTLICRFKRTTSSALGFSLRSRASTTKRSVQSCDVSFIIREYANHVEFHITRTQPTIHAYLLDKSDANKRNSLFRGLVQLDIAKGYAPAAVIGSIRGNGQSDVRARLAAAGGAYLTRQDAINSGASWRLANPNALFVSRDFKDMVLL